MRGSVTNFGWGWCIVGASCLACSGEGDADPGAARAPVEIAIDDHGVPHIYGATDRDAFIGAGYAMGLHRMLQADMARRRALGRWAEVLGPERQADDHLARYFGWREVGYAAAAITERDNPEEWAILSAWTEGLNRRIAEVRAGTVPLPHGFGPGEHDYLPEPWAPEDVLVVAKMFGFGNDLTLDFEVFATLAEKLRGPVVAKVDLPRPAHAVFAVPPEDLPTAARAGQAHGASGTPPRPPAPASASAPYTIEPRGWRALQRLRVFGSNNWAVDGRFTDDGRPKLCGDPHLGFTDPGLFYALHIDSQSRGGTFNVAGFSFPGLPGVSIGHTDRLMWSPTTAFADVMDVFELPLSGAGGVDIDGQVVPFETRTEHLIVRRPGDAVGDGAAEELTVRVVPGWGPVLEPEVTAGIPVASAGHVAVLRWTGYDVSASRLLAIDRAHTLDEFDAAIDLQAGLNFNMVAADTSGITYRVGVNVPDRDVSQGQRPWTVMDGSDQKTRWTGALLPRDRLPRGRAASQGFIATANNDPFGFTANGRVDDDAWYYGAFFDPGWRAQRLQSELSRLTARGDVTLADLQTLQGDTHDNLADDYLALFSAAWAKVGSDASLAEFDGRPELAALADLLTSWDRKAVRDSRGATAFTLFAQFVTSATIADDLSFLYPQIRDLQTLYLFKFALLALRGDYAEGADLVQGGVDRTLLTALDQTAALISARWGSLAQLPEYGALHATDFHDALGSGLAFGSAPSDGSETSVNVSPTVVYVGDEVAPQWTSSYGPILRHCEDLGADGTPRMSYDFALGNIADPASPHFGDQTDLWLNAEHRRMWFTTEEVAAHTESRLELR